MGLLNLLAAILGAGVLTAIPTTGACEELNPTLFSHTAVDAFMENAEPVTFPIDWDFDGNYSVPRISQRAQRWYADKRKFYENFSEVQFSEGKIELSRTTIPLDANDSLPDAVTWAPNLQAGLAENGQWPNVIYRSLYQEWQRSGVSQNEFMPETAKSRFRAGYSASEEQKLGVVLYSGQYWNTDRWNSLTDLDTDSRELQFYDLRTMTLFGNELKLSWWFRIPRDAVVCVSQAEKLVNQEVEQIRSFMDVPWNDHESSFFLLDPIRSLNVVERSISPYAQNLAFARCGAFNADVQFIGFIDFGMGPHFGLLEPSDTKMVFQEPIKPIDTVRPVGPIASRSELPGPNTSRTEAIDLMWLEVSFCRTADRRPCIEACRLGARAVTLLPKDASRDQIWHHLRSCVEVAK
jgi:hypothetical protein